MASIFNIFLGFLLFIIVIVAIFFVIYFIIIGTNNNCVSKNIASPSNFTYSLDHNGTNTSYILNWNTVQNVDGYAIYQGTDPDFKPNTSNIINTINNPETNNYIGDGSLGGTYYFYISSFVTKNNKTCYSDPYPKSPLVIQINSAPVGITLYISQTSYCSYYKKPLTMSITTRPCPYGSGNQIGFQYTDKLGNDNQFIFTAAGTISPFKDTTQCIYYINNNNNIPCYTTCNSIPDNQKIWEKEQKSNGYYIKLANASSYLAGYRGGLESQFHGPFIYTSKPLDNLDCKKSDIFPLWEPVTS